MIEKIRNEKNITNLNRFKQDEDGEKAKGLNEKSVIELQQEINSSPYG